MPAMRVAMIGPFGLRPKGTMAVRALPLAKALVRRGHEVAMFLPPWSFLEDAGKVWDVEGVRVENVAISPRAFITPRLVSRARAWRPDVAHFFKPKAYAGLAQWQLWQMRSVGLHHARLVLDTDDWEGAGGWNEVENYSWAQKKVFAWQEQWGLRHCDAITVASRALETIVWSLGRARHEVHYLPNGVGPSVSAWRADGASLRAEMQLGAEPVILLYTRFFEFRVERVMEIFAQIVQQMPDVHLLVVGKGLFGEEQKLLAIAHERDWERRVRYTGWVDQARLPEYFAAANLAIYPFDDTLLNRCKCPVKLTDLLAAGVPVAAEAVGQNKEYIAHNETGILVPSSVVEEFACAVVNLLRDHELRARLGKNAAAAIAREYSWDKLARVAEEAYQRSF